MGPPSRPAGFNLPAKGGDAGASGSSTTGPRRSAVAGGCTFRGVSATTGSHGGMKPGEKVASASRGCFIALRGHCPLSDRGTRLAVPASQARAPGPRRAHDWGGLISVLSDRVWCVGSGLLRARHAGSVAIRSAPYPTRLETRTEESNMCASRWDRRILKAQ